MFSKTTLAIFAALTATASVTALPTQYSEYADLVERDFYDNAELVERDYFDAVELAERDLFDMDFEELAARQDPNAPQVDPTAAQAGATAPPAGAVAPPTQVSSAPSPHGHGHGHGHGGHGHGHGPHGQGVGRHGHHSHGHHGPIPAHHLKADGTRKSRSGRKRANRKLRKQQAAAAAAQSQTAPSPQSQGAPGPGPSAAGAGAMAPPVVAREILLEERGLLETLGLKARVANLSAKQTSKMNSAKTVCAGLSSKKDQKKCHKNVDKIIQLTKERNYDIEQFNKIAPGHDSVFAPADATTATHPASSLLSLGARY